MNHRYRLAVAAGFVALLGLVPPAAFAASAPLEALTARGGEAESAALKFRALEAADGAALSAFLKSL